MEGVRLLAALPGAAVRGDGGRPPHPALSPATARWRGASPAALGSLPPRLRPYAGRLGLALLALVVAAAVGLAFPLVVQHLLDAAFERGDRGLLDRVAVLLLALFAVQGVANYVQVFLLSSTTERVIATLREDVFSHLLRLAPAYFADRRTGELTSRLSSDLTTLQTLMNTWVSECTRQVLLLVGGVVLLTLTHTRLTVTTLAVTPVIVGAAILFGRSLRAATTGVQDRVADAMGLADESISQIRVVQGFTREAVERARFATLLRGVVAAAVARARLRALFFGVVGFVAFAGVVAVLYQGGLLVLDGVLTPGALVAFLLYAITVAAAVGALAALFGHYQEALGAARRIFEILAVRTTVPEPVQPVALPRPVRGDIVFDRVWFRYDAASADTLRDVAFHVAPGEVVALVGPSGAGKTTIASLLPRFWDVRDGSVRLDGLDVRTLSLHDVRRAIGMVPQEPALFSGSIRDNIAFGDPEASDEAVQRAARAAHAAEFIDRLPEGYATRVGERGVKLSGGQRQRVALARVFLKDPAVVVLDEATSALDAESERLVEDAMETLLRGRTTLIIAHRLSTVRRADRILVIDRGALVESGTYEALVAQGGLFATLVAAGLRGGGATPQTISSAS